MKKIWSIVLVLVFLMGMLQIGASAQGKVENLVPPNGEYEVHYYFPDEMSARDRSQIVAKMRGDEDAEPEQDRNIICTLFGHDYVTKSVTTVTHNVYTTSPKCVMNTYDTKTCQRCGHVETELTSSVRISTCHG